jgi:hypothetical protein
MYLIPSLNVHHSIVALPHPNRSAAPILYITIIAPPSVHPYYLPLPPPTLVDCQMSPSDAADYPRATASSSLDVDVFTLCLHDRSCPAFHQHCRP